MKCRQAKNLIFDHIDGMISEPDRVSLERHLNECKQCEAMATGLTRSLGLLHKLPAVEPSESFNWNLRLRLLKEKNAIRAGVETERQWFRAWNTRFAMSAVSAFAVILVAGAVLLKTGPNVTDSQKFVLKPDAMSQAASKKTPSRPAETAARTSTFDPRLLTGPTGVGPRPVSWGPPAGQSIPMAIEDSQRPVLDTDSLKTRFLQTRQFYFRVRQLEQQVELLQSELHKCNSEKD